jgi:hypothetical protein
MVARNREHVGTGQLVSASAVPDWLGFLLSALRGEHRPERQHQAFLVRLETRYRVNCVAAKDEQAPFLGAHGPLSRWKPQVERISGELVRNGGSRVPAITGISQIVEPEWAGLVSVVTPQRLLAGRVTRANGPMFLIGHLGGLGRTHRFDLVRQAMSPEECGDGYLLPSPNKLKRLKPAHARLRAPRPVIFRRQFIVSLDRC